MAGVKKQDSPAKGAQENALKEESAKIDSSVSATTPKTPITPKILPEQSIFNVNFCYENLELISFSVEKQGENKIGTQNNSSTTPSSSEAVSTPTPQTTQQQEVKGSLELCTFILDHFGKVSNTTCDSVYSLWFMFVC